MAVRLAKTGPRSWRMSRDNSGHYEYHVVHRAEADSVKEGPYQVSRLGDLPQVGDIYDFGNGETDPAATCTAQMQITEVGGGDDVTQYYDVEQVFSTKPLCLLAVPDNPLLEPAHIGGTFVKFQEEAVRDRFGEPVTSSSHEQLRGPQVEFDANRPQITIEQNVLNLSLPLLSLMVDTVNINYLWGFPPRTVKLSNVDWEELYHGRCVKFYKRKLTFDIRYRCIDGVTSTDVIGESDTGTGLGTGFGTGTSLLGECAGGYETFDRILLDEGTKVLRGHWGRGGAEGTGWVLDCIDFDEFGCLEFPNPDNPAHFIRFKDRNNENARVILDGHGRPWDPAGDTTGTGDDEPGRITVEKYGESNFLLLGIPAAIG